MSTVGVFGTMEMHQLLAALGTRPADQGLCFDFDGVMPTGLSSYRGFYEHLAVEYGHDSPECRRTVGEFVTLLRSALGQTFEGYKGGTYRMGMQTPVWVGSWGHCNSTAIVGICEAQHWCILKTEWVDV